METTMDSPEIQALISENEGLKKEIEDLKKQLARLETESTAASDAQNAFLYKISHELRTPLNVVIGFSRLELAKAQDSLEAEVMLQIFNAGHELLCIVNNIIDLVAASSGNLELYNTSFYMSRILGELSRKMHARLEKTSVAFRLEISDSIPEQVFGDFLRLGQIFENLLINAASYTTEGEIVLKLDCEKTEGSNYNFLASVSDTGSGMSQDVLSNILTDCKLFGTHYHKNLSGSGFGLAITCYILMLMEGDLWAESEPGKGSTFQFSFCMGYVNDNLINKKELQKDEFIFNELQKNIKEEQSEQTYDISVAKILITDDVQTNLILEKALLAPFGIVPDLAENGFKCLEMMRKNTYDLVLMDQMMPGMDGLETFNHIRNDGDILNGKDIPVIMVTANASPQSESRFLSLGFAGYIVKPVYSRRLYELISKCLSSSSFGNGSHNIQIQKATPKALAHDFFVPPLTDLVTGNNILSENNKRDLLQNQYNTKEKIAASNPKIVATVSEAPNGNASQDALAVPEGIDVAAGIAMFNGRKDIYNAVAKGFLSELYTYLSEFDLNMDHAHYESQIPIMLKSIAALDLPEEFISWRKSVQASDAQSTILRENLMKSLKQWIEYFDGSEN